MDPHHGSTMESQEINCFRSWFIQNNGYIHPSVLFQTDAYGRSVQTKADLQADSLIISCPFSLAITVDVAKNGLVQLFPDHTALEKWTERQLICSYICMHWVLEPLSEDLLQYFKYGPYLKILPLPSQLRTPLYFSDVELECIKGTNLYGATIDRRNLWKNEWTVCYDVFDEVNKVWGSAFTCDRYFTAATYISSRAFPSTLLSTSPSLTPNPQSYPTLLPGVDALDHRRGQPVTWSITEKTLSDEDAKSTNSTAITSVGLIIHSPVAKGEELFNNYGAKPNSELILGYGFSLEDNPDDTIMLKIAVIDKTWEIGRNARGVEVLWEEFRLASSDEENDFSYTEQIENDLDCVERLSDMVKDLLDRFPHNVDLAVMRPEVAVMWKDYVTGQREILLSVLEYTSIKERAIIEEGRSQGVDIIIRDEETEVI